MSYLSENAEKRKMSLDVLRVVAIIMVFGFHFPKPDGVSIFGPLARFGWMGVDLFFVLSGYLIGSQIIKRMRSHDGFSYKDFYVSRFLRTLPVYFAVLAAYFTFDGFREKPMISPLWRFLTFTQNFEALDLAFSHAWSLCIEEQFYLVCPALLLTLTRIKSARVVLLVASLLVVAGALYRHWTWLDFQSAMTPENKWDIYLESIYYPTWGRLDGLIFGVLAAAIEQYRPEIWSALSKRRAYVGTAGVVMFSAAIFLFTDRLSWSATVFGYPILALSFALLVMVAASAKTSLSWLRSIGVGQVAILSYSFYLIHKQVMNIISTHWSFGSSDGDQFIFAVVSFAASLAMAFLMYELIERPFLMIREKLLRR